MSAIGSELRSLLLPLAGGTTILLRELAKTSRILLNIKSLSLALHFLKQARWGRKLYSRPKCSGGGKNEKGKNGGRWLY